jgi:ceramide glucosyltransferase
MSCLFRKSVVDEIGGLRAFGCYLAEDYFLGMNIQKKGYKLRVTSQPAWQNPGPGDLPSFQARIRR